MEEGFFSTEERSPAAAIQARDFQDLPLQDLFCPHCRTALCRGSKSQCLPCSQEVPLRCLEGTASSTPSRKRGRLDGVDVRFPVFVTVWAERCSNPAPSSLCVSLHLRGGGDCAEIIQAGQHGKSVPLPGMTLSSPSRRAAAPGRPKQPG